MGEKAVFSGEAGGDARFRALLSNASAARAVAESLEGSIGPKGLDTMMVDRCGDVTITNDGATILTLMEVNHPAARMLINTARAQQTAVGDGTTTVTLLAGALITGGAEQIMKGVPATRVIEGIKTAMEHVIDLTRQHARPLTSLRDAAAYNIALVASRGDRELAELVLEAARLLGEQRLLEDEFRFADSVKGFEGVTSEVLSGVLVNKDPVNSEMPYQVENARILVIDDALAPEDMGREARGTEAGLRRFLKLRQCYETSLHKLIQAGTSVILVDREIDDLAEEILTEAGVMVIQRVAHRELARVCEHTGARMVKRTVLNRNPEAIAGFLGTAGLVQNSRKVGHTRVCHGGGQPAVTVLVGAATGEVAAERERVARDAAASLQAALKGGVVPGGGAFEVWLAGQVTRIAEEARGLTSYGAECVKEALVRPFSCIVTNAGFNPLEKLEEVMSAQRISGSSCIGVDCNRGEVSDMVALGVVDPALVKTNAFQSAAEVARAILRINTIVKKVDGGQVNGFDVS